MDERKEKKGFWAGLLRNSSLAKKVANPLENERDREREREPARRSAEENTQPPRTSRRRAMAGGSEGQRQRPRARRPELEEQASGQTGRKGSRRIPAAASTSATTKEDDAVTSVRTHSLTPLTRWPPTNLSSHEELPHQHAVELIARGAPSHKGRKRSIPHAPDQFYALFATTTGNHGGETDAANLHESMVQLMTLRMQAQGHATYPWETLEQPSYSFFYGQRSGTITLNHWASVASVLPPTITLRDSRTVPRLIDLDRIFERLKDLQAGLEDDDEGLLYRNLYRKLLRDPDKVVGPHRTLDKQITDLILVLSRPDWINFTDPKNQVVTRFIFDTSEANQTQYHKFFHQLLLSLELELRIHSPQHGDWAKEKLLKQIPPTIQWNLALARRWRENVRVEEFGYTPDQTKLRYKLKKRQVKLLRRFAQLMKWPNLGQTLENLRQRDEDFRLDTISSDAFAYFSGLVVPGPTYPFLMMNTLIDLDPDEATDALALLSHMHPNCGFQYRNSHTYWSSSCIVGKVLAPTCHSVAGWVGPGRPTADLGRSQIARIRSRRPRQRMSREDVESMGERSDALGPPAEIYPVDEYSLPKLVDDGFNVDTVRVELLSFKRATDETTVSGPRLFDATVQFAIDGMSWPMRLMYDVSFISAWPCSDGPHPLFFDYVYTVMKVDEIMNVRDWGGVYRGQQQNTVPNSARSTPAPAGSAENGSQLEHDDERVLVVEAVGVRDNEVLARAWCSHWGLSAVVADIRKTCMACAIREAYAATLTVVILVDDRFHDNDE